MSDTPGPRWAERVYLAVYHRDDWKIPDAFRPQPGWGTRTFSVDASALGEHTEGEFIEAAQTNPPAGHRLTKVSVLEPGAKERVLWSTAPDPRFNKASQATATPPEDKGSQDQ